MADEALIIIDIQNDYFKHGKMALFQMEEAALKAGKLLEHFRTLNKPVFHIQHFSVREGATFFVPETKGVEINSLVKPKEGESVISKNYPNSFRETSLHDELKKVGIKKLTVCGAMSHMCIDTSVRAAFDLGYSCVVAFDACATKDLEFDGIKVEAPKVHASYMAGLSAVFAEVIKTETIIKNLLL